MKIWVEASVVFCVELYLCWRYNQLNSTWKLAMDGSTKSHYSFTPEANLQPPGTS